MFVFRVKKKAWNFLGSRKMFHIFCNDIVDKNRITSEEKKVILKYFVCLFVRYNSLGISPFYYLLTSIFKRKKIYAQKTFHINAISTHRSNSVRYFIR